MGQAWEGFHAQNSSKHHFCIICKQLLQGRQLPTSLLSPPPHTPGSGSLNPSGALSGAEGAAQVRPSKAWEGLGLGQDNLRRALVMLRTQRMRTAQLGVCGSSWG